MNRILVAIAATCALATMLYGLLVLLAIHPELIDSRYRAYKKLYRSIQIGMTRDEVLKKMGDQYPPNGARQTPVIMEDTTNSFGLFMNPEESKQPNCEGIFLKMEDGRVVSKRYSPD